MIARAGRVDSPRPAHAGWDEPTWKDIPSTLLANWMGEKPDHFPKTEVKIGWDAASIHLFFRVEDRFVRAVAAHHQESVCGDSCVEFFFTPGPELFPGYFNMEVNCGGTMLFHFHPRLARAGIAIAQSYCETISVVHSLPKTIEREIEEPVVWTVAYSLPAALLERYCPVSPPASHTRWRANFYKCADRTSHPHWLTWAPVDFDRPNFHVPQSFGTLVFEE